MAALIGLALAPAYLQLVVIAHFLPDLTAFALVKAIVAGICATGWRWTPLLGALLSIMMMSGNLDGVIHDITHPESFHLFAFIVVALALTLVGMVAGISATAQNYRSRERGAPRMLPPRSSRCRHCAWARFYPQPFRVHPVLESARKCLPAFQRSVRLLFTSIEKRSG